MIRIAMVVDEADLKEPENTREPPPVVLAGALADAGHEVTILTRRGNGRRPSDGRFRIVHATDLAKAVRTCRPDLVHAHSWELGLAAAEGARRLDVPFVFSVHAGRQAQDADGQLAVLHAADHVIAKFSAQVRPLLATGVPRQRISVVPYGVDVEHFTPDGAHAERRRPHRVIALGAMRPATGFGTSVAALAGLPDVELTLAGAPGHGRHANDLRAYARSLGVADQVRFAGPVARAELPALLRSADLMVCTPWEATFGIAALEGMACGVAVVANGMGGLADTVVDQVTGTHVTPRKPRELAAALRWLLGHTTVCEQRGAAGRDRATARYSWERIAAEMLYAYRRAGAADPEVLAREAAAAARKRGAAAG